MQGHGDAREGVEWGRGNRLLKGHKQIEPGRGKIGRTSTPYIQISFPGLIHADLHQQYHYVDLLWLLVLPLEKVDKYLLILMRLPAAKSPLQDAW